MSQTVTFGARLKEARLACKFTQEEVAKRLHVSRVAYGYYENGSREMRGEDIAAVCRLLGISADYLLGLSDTKNPVYAKVAEETGLTQEAILRLRQRLDWESQLINDLLAEEPYICNEMNPEAEAYFNSPEQIEKQYQEHLRCLEWEKEMKQTPILEHLATEWAHNDYMASLTSEEHCARSEAIAQVELGREDVPIPNDLVQHPMSLEEMERQEESAMRYRQQEEAKSKLLSAIGEYVHYRSGCTLYAMTGYEDLTEAHPVHIGAGIHQRITFPSREADELLEFMLLQKVIEALKIFKQNRYSESEVK